MAKTNLYIQAVMSIWFENKRGSWVRV